MEKIFNFILENWQDLLPFVLSFIAVIVNLVLFKRTKNIKYLMEVQELLKYKTAQSVSSEPVKVQSFDNLKPVYRLNKSTNMLELTDEVVDIQAEIDSMKDYCLRACLERMEAFYQDDDNLTQQELESCQSDLDDLIAYYQRAEQIRDKYNLSADLSVTEVYNTVNERAKTIKQKIAEAQQKQKSNIMEVKQNETSQE